MATHLYPSFSPKSQRWRAYRQQTVQASAREVISVPRVARAHFKSSVRGESLAPHVDWRTDFALR